MSASTRARAAELGHHYAGRGNEFWRVPAASGLTPRLLAPDEQRELLRWGIGLTNLVARPTVGSGGKPAPNSARACRDLMQTYQPKVVAYKGKGVYLAASGKSRAAWGLQEASLFDPVCGVSVRDVVLPSPSGRVRLSFADQLEHYRTSALFFLASSQQK